MGNTDYEVRTENSLHEILQRHLVIYSFNETRIGSPPLTVTNAVLSEPEPIAAGYDLHPTLLRFLRRLASVHLNKTDDNTIQFVRNLIVVFREAVVRMMHDLLGYVLSTRKSFENNLDSIITRNIFWQVNTR